MYNKMINIFKKILTEGRISLLFILLLLWDITSILLDQKKQSMNNQPVGLVAVAPIIGMLGISLLESGIIIAFAKLLKKEKIHFTRLITAISVCYIPAIIDNVIQIIFPDRYYNQNTAYLIVMLLNIMMFSFLIEQIFKISFKKSLAISSAWSVIYLVLKNT